MNFLTNTGPIIVILATDMKMEFYGVFSIILTKNGSLEPLLIILRQILAKKMFLREEQFTHRSQEIQKKEK